jgi:hypothetical protein
MNRSPRGGLLHGVSLIVAGLPVAFALIRAVRTGYDLRYLWVALASLVGAAAVMAVGRRYNSTPLVAVALSAAALVAAMLLALLAALLLGTRPGAGILVVAFAFALCCAASCLLHLLASR